MKPPKLVTTCKVSCLAPPVTESRDRARFQPGDRLEVTDSSPIEDLERDFFGKSPAPWPWPDLAIKVESMFS
jgi:hypothetical protein